VLDEVAFGLELAGIDRAEALRRAQLVIDRFDIQAGGTAYQAIGLEAIEDTRDARAVDADGTELTVY